MKHLLLLTVLIYSFSLSFSQNFSFGPEAGINIIPTENTNIGQNYQLGFVAGGNFKYHISDNFKISTGIYLSQKKKKYAVSDTSSLVDMFSEFLQLTGDNSEIDSLINSVGVNTDILNTTNGIASSIFIEVPILANFSYKSFNFYVGPYFGALIAVNKKEEVITHTPLLNAFDVSQLDTSGFLSFFLPPENDTITKTSTAKDNFRSLDFGANVGIGYEMNNVHFNLMYSQGLVDYRIDKKNGTNSPYNSIRVSVAYLFNYKENKQPVITN